VGGIKDLPGFRASRAGWKAARHSPSQTNRFSAKKYLAAFKRWKAWVSWHRMAVCCYQLALYLHGLDIFNSGSTLTSGIKATLEGLRRTPSKSWRSWNT